MSVCGQLRAGRQLFFAAVRQRDDLWSWRRRLFRGGRCHDLIWRHCLTFTRRNQFFQTQRRAAHGERGLIELLFVKDPGEHLQREGQHQQPDLPPARLDIGGDFLDAVERADIGTAVDALQWTGDASSKLKQQLAGAATSLGKSDGHEIIAVRRISPRLHQIYGAIHYEKQPLLFVLHPRYYSGAWRIQTVTFTADPKGMNDLAPLEPVAPASGERVAARF